LKGNEKGVGKRKTPPKRKPTIKLPEPTIFQLD
jgi:hypothetical protein